MTDKRKLELAWISKEKRPRAEPRILLENPDKPYHARLRVTEGGIFDNRLIFGNNLLALEAKGGVRFHRLAAEKRDAVGDAHDYVLVYAMNAAKFKGQHHPTSMDEEQAKVYRNPDNDLRGRWQPVSMTAQAGHAASEQFYKILIPSGAIHHLSEGHCRGVARVAYKYLLGEDRIYFGKDENTQFNIIRYLSEVPGVASWTGRSHEEVGHTDEAKKEMHALELGGHCRARIIPRLKKVIDGGGKGGITESTGWQGGGSFRYYKLASGLIVNDRWGNPVINPACSAAHLAEALCELEGFNNAPSEVRWRQHGHSSEQDFIYVTTQNLSAGWLRHVGCSLNVANLLMAAPSLPPSLAQAGEGSQKRQAMQTADLFDNAGAAEYLTFVAASSSPSPSMKMCREDGNIWLTQKMAVLYDMTAPAINRHLKLASEAHLADEDLAEDAVIEKYSITVADGKNHTVRHDNLQALLPSVPRSKENRASRLIFWSQP